MVSRTVSGVTPSTQTILFTDIEGSTRMARALGDRWAGVVGAHHAAIGAAIEARRGRIEGTAGDSFFALFASAGDAVAAAADAQRRLAALPWPPDGDVKGGMGLHRGEGRRGRPGLTGLDLPRGA